VSQATQDFAFFRPFRKSGAVSSSAGQRSSAPPSPAAEPSDRALALALLAQDRGAPRLAWSRFSPLVRRMLARFFGPGIDVEDFVQEVFLCLFRQLRTLRDPGALRAFVMAITIRTAHHQARRARARRWLKLSAGAAVEDVTSTTDVAAQYAVLRLYSLLSRLRERDRTAFVLRFIEGMQADEIADAIGVSVPTVRRRFMRAWARVTLLASRDPFLSRYLHHPAAKVHGDPSGACAALAR
jgi:RNA polymerase sigma-70 factor, ECF subfamily